jgi:acetyltransferase-like isoleucine patch superfamily enzyme
MSDMLLPHDWFDKPLPANCELGDRAWLYSSFAFVHSRSQGRASVVIGEDTGLYNGTFFDLGPNAQIRIGRFCTVVGAIFSTRRSVVIGDYVFISHEVVLADHEMAVPPFDDECEAGISGSDFDIIIEDDVWIGARAMILGGVRIGAGAIIGAAAVVDRNVPSYAIFAGNPGRIVGSIPRTRDSQDSSSPHGLP